MKKKKIEIFVRKLKKKKIENVKNQRKKLKKSWKFEKKLKNVLEKGWKREKESKEKLNSILIRKQFNIIRWKKTINTFGR